MSVSALLLIYYRLKWTTLQTIKLIYVFLDIIYSEIKMLPTAAWTEVTMVICHTTIYCL